MTTADIEEFEERFARLSKEQALCLLRSARDLALSGQFERMGGLYREFGLEGEAIPRPASQS